LYAGADVNEDGEKFGNALQTASYEGHEKVIRLLLAPGADVNQVGGEHEGAPHSSYKGRESIVQILFEAGADVTLGSGGAYGNALQVASYMGYAKLVRMPFISWCRCQSRRRRVWKHSRSSPVFRTPTNSPTGWKYGNALLAAACVGYEKVVQQFKSQAGVNTEWLTPLRTEP
jgi:hypothetical protein